MSPRPYSLHPFASHCGCPPRIDPPGLTCDWPVRPAQSGLRDFAQNQSACRRRLILDFFGETPQFDRCGSCDNCKKWDQYGADLDRNYKNEVLILLKCLEAAPSQSMTYLLLLIRGKRLKYVPSGEKKAVHGLGNGKRMALADGADCDDFWKALLQALAQLHYVERNQKTMQVDSGYKRTFDVWTLDELGLSTLATFQTGGKAAVSAIMIPVPQCIRDTEAKETARAAKVAAKVREELEYIGVDWKAEIPVDERRAGGGVVTETHKRYAKLLQQLRRKTKGEEEVVARQELLRRVRDWRSITAQKHGMVPADVFEPHLAKEIALKTPTSPEDVTAIGVRDAVWARELAELIVNWTQETTGVRLEAQGNDTSEIPKFELREGQGKAIDPFKYYHDALDRLRDSGKPAKAAAVEVRVQRPLLRVRFPFCEIRVHIDCDDVSPGAASVCAELAGRNRGEPRAGANGCAGRGRRCIAGLHKSHRPGSTASGGEPGGRHGRASWANSSLEDHSHRGGSWWRGCCRREAGVARWCGYSR